MVETPKDQVALFSIRPQYAEAILNGTKTVEFRRRALRPTVRFIVIYSTSPVQRIVGAFAVSGVASMTPVDAWRRYGSVGGIGLEDFFAYYEGSTTAVAIGIGSRARAAVPLLLSAIDPLIRPPQAWMYVREAAQLNGLADLLALIGG